MLGLNTDVPGVVYPSADVPGVVYPSTDVPGVVYLARLGREAPSRSLKTSFILQFQYDYIDCNTHYRGEG